MLPSRRVPPVWLMGLSNATMGFCNGLVFFVLPQLMAAEHVPELRIASITAVAFSPCFWVFLLSPMLDIRFSRRWYATVFAAVSGFFVAVAIVALHHLLALEIAMLLITLFFNLSSSALCGWLANVADHKDKNTLSKWLNIGLISGTGVASLLGGEIVRHLPVALAATALGLLVFVPTGLFLLIPAPGPDRRLASESFGQFNRDLLALVRRRRIVVVLLLFLSPCSSFALTNLLGGLGADFHASGWVVSFAGGAGAFFPGILGCFLFPIIARGMPLRFFYLANGILGSIFTLSLLLFPHVPWTFALAVFGEFLFQAVAFSIQIGIVFEAIGPSNPLAATTFAFLTAATNVPVTCMMLADGRAYSALGVGGSFAVDAAIGIATCLLAAILLARFDFRVPMPSPQLIDALPEEN